MTQIEQEARALADFHQFFIGKEETLTVMFGVEAFERFHTATAHHAERHTAATQGWHRQNARNAKENGNDPHPNIGFHPAVNPAGMERTARDRSPTDCHDVDARKGHAPDRGLRHRLGI